METKIPIMIAIGFHLRQDPPTPPNKSNSNNENTRHALIQAIDHSDANYGLPKLPPELKNLLTTLTSHLKQHNTIPPLLSQILLNTPEDPALGRDAMVDSWKSWADTFSSESLASVDFLNKEQDDLIKAWKPAPLPTQKHNDLQKDYSHCLDNFGSTEELKAALTQMLSN